MFMDIQDVETFVGPALMQINATADADPAAAYCGIKLSFLNQGYKPRGDWKKTSRDFGGSSIKESKDEITEYSVISSLLSFILDPPKSRLVFFQSPRGLYPWFRKDSLIPQYA